MLISAYLQSDLFGKAIFLLILALSSLTWIIILYKGFQIFGIKKMKRDFENFLHNKKNALLNIDIASKKQIPIFDVFFAIQTKTKDLLKKNSKMSNKTTFISKADLDSIIELKETSIQLFLKNLEKNLYFLSLTVTLAPFLGLLGTVWGILIAFFEMQGSNTMRDAVLGGLATALTTTVLGLVVAIPALIGYHVLKNKTKEIGLSMQSSFSNFIGILELQYRSID